MYYIFLLTLVKSQIKRIYHFSKLVLTSTLIFFCILFCVKYLLFCQKEAVFLPLIGGHYAYHLEEVERSCWVEVPA